MAGLIWVKYAKPGGARGQRNKSTIYGIKTVSRLAPPTMEKRRARAMVGTIEFGRSAFSCIGIDRKLNVPSLIGIPHQFDLVIDGSRFSCRVARRKKDRSRF